MGNITAAGRVDWTDLKYVQLPPLEQAKYLLAAGDVLFNRTNSVALVGKSAVFDGRRESIFASYLIRFRMKAAAADPWFVCHYLNSPYGRVYIQESLGRAIGQANVAASVMHRMPIPVPPLPEQRRIVAHLAIQLAAVERARAAAEARLEAARGLSTAILARTFSAAATARWRAERLGRLVSLRRDVVHPRDQPTGTAVFVGLEHIEPGTGRRLGSLELRLEGLTGRKPSFRRDDIVYGYLRPYLNKVWVAEFDGLCSVDQYVFSVDASLADARFLAWFMRSTVFLERARADSGPGQLPRIRIDEIAAVEVPLPSLEEQHLVVSQLEDALAGVHRITAAADVAAINAVPAALLRRAFSGEL